MCPLYLTDLLLIMKISCYSLRLNRAPTVPNFRTERFKSTFFPSCSSNWNQLDPNIQNSASIEFLNEHYLVLFVLSQLMYTGFTIHED